MWECHSLPWKTIPPTGLGPIPPGCLATGRCRQTRATPRKLCADLLLAFVGPSVKSSLLFVSLPYDRLQVRRTDATCLESGQSSVNSTDGPSAVRLDIQEWRQSDGRAIYRTPRLPRMASIQRADSMRLLTRLLEASQAFLELLRQRGENNGNARGMRPRQRETVRGPRRPLRQQGVLHPRSHVTLERKTPLKPVRGGHPELDPHVFAATLFQLI